MPELPEVETVRRGLASVLEGNPIVKVEQRRKDLRFPFPERFAEGLAGQHITALARRAKYLIAHLSGGEALIMHLGMSGSFRIVQEDEVAVPGSFHHQRAAAGPHDHVVFHMKSGARVIYNDPRRFGFMVMAQQGALDTHPLLAGLGLEPLGNELGAAFLNTALRGKTTSLKAVLMDQRIVAGLGNIYVCEALHRCGLSPKRKAGTLTRKNGLAPRLEQLATSIREVLGEAILAGGSSLRDHRQANGELGYFQHTFRAYGREGEPCRTPGCAGHIKRIVQQGRSTFYCPACQR